MQILVTCLMLGLNGNVQGPAGVRTYAYAANAVTVTDLKGKWKKSEPNAMGELRYVKEPAPGICR